MIPRLIVAAGAFNVEIAITVTPADLSLDMTTVTAVAFDVIRSDGSSDSWTPTIEAGATPLQLVAVYVTEPGDLVEGTTSIAITATGPGGAALPCTSVELLVQSKYHFAGGP